MKLLTDMKFNRGNTPVSFRCAPVDTEAWIQAMVNNSLTGFVFRLSSLQIDKMFLAGAEDSLCIPGSARSGCADHVKTSFPNWNKAKKGKNVEKLIWTMMEYRKNCIETE